jgi:hypothetical protein
MEFDRLGDIAAAEEVASDLEMDRTPDPAPVEGSGPGVLVVVTDCPTPGGAVTSLGATEVTRVMWCRWDQGL